MHAKKSLSQNFLTSPAIARAMVYAAELTPEDTVVEIGPGKGILTEALLRQTGEIIAIEKDRRLVPELRERFSQAIKARKLKVVEGDALRFDFSGLHDYKVVANIPYNITGELIRLFLSHGNQPRSITLMLQKEVAERIMGKEGESVLSLSVKACGKPSIVRRVPAGSFHPRPKVDSAIVHIANISKDFFANITEKRFFELVKAGFTHKRKFLASNLMKTERKAKISEAFARLGISPKVRAEELLLEQWRQLTVLLPKN